MKNRIWTKPKRLRALKNKKVNLIPITQQDANQEYLRWINNKEVNRYLDSRYKKYTLKELEVYVKKVLKDRNSLFYSIRIPSSNEHVGNIKLGPVHPYNFTADIGFLIGKKKYWGQGLASNSIKLLSEYAFELGIIKVTGGTYENNYGSIKAFKKCKFRKEGTLKNQVFSGKDRIASHIFALDNPFVKKL